MRPGVTMLAESLAGLVFLPLLAACALLVLPAPARAWAALAGVLPLPLLLWPLTTLVWQEGPQVLHVAGFAPPLGIAWRVDALSLLLLWLNAVIALVVGLHALSDYPPRSPRGRRFWALWLLLATAINALLLSADLFNLFVTLELVTLAAIGLLVIDNKPAALRAGMRYLLLALLGSLLYLMGVALVYAQLGTLDLYAAADGLAGQPIGRLALALMSIGLLLKSAIFPLHGWLPAAHGNAPGPVSAVLSAVVVKASVYLLWRLWLWMADAEALAAVGLLLGLLGAAAILYGSLQALRQQRLKMLVAYSTVAQLGYLMLLFPLAGAVGFQGASYHLLAHGLAKAAMFLAVANLLRALGSDRLDALAGADRSRPLDTFAFALAGVSILGLPPSGGFIAKWLLLQQAWSQGAALWVLLILVGGLLAAAYLFRALSMLCARPPGPAALSPVQTVPAASSLLALLLALAAVLLGFVPAPLLELLSAGGPAWGSP